MKKPTAVLVLFLLAATPGVAATRGTSPADQFIAKLVRRVKTFFGVHTTGDQLKPPLPAPCDPAQGPAHSGGRTASSDGSGADTPELPRSAAR